MPTSYRLMSWEQGGQEELKEATEMKLSRIHLSHILLKA